MEQLTVSQMVSALSYALDLTEGQPMGHSARVCLLGMRVAAEIGMPRDERADLYYALLLKDAGCSSNASRLFHVVASDEIVAKRDWKTTDWTRVGFESLQYAIAHVAVGKPSVDRITTLARVAMNRVADSRDLVQIRGERGASVARRMGFNKRVADGIHYLDEHWNGQGYPDQLRGGEIPLLSRIALLCQTLEVFWQEHGEERALDVVVSRAGRWFEPELVRAVESLAERDLLWERVDSSSLLETVWALEPKDKHIPLTPDRIDDICLAFAEVVDAKSPFTYRHSNGVAEAAVAIGKTLGVDNETLRLLRRAGLLHDIGMLSVPNSILEKPAELDADEWAIVKRHPYYSWEILRRIPGFGPLSEVAGSHQERLDGNGYFRGLDAERLDQPSRILAVADVYSALSAKRPYREALPLEAAMETMRRDAPHALDADCVEALATAMNRSLVNHNAPAAQQ